MADLGGDVQVLKIDIGNSSLLHGVPDIQVPEEKQGILSALEAVCGSIKQR
jgi:hypothetical protein